MTIHSPHCCCDHNDRALGVLLSSAVARIVSDSDFNYRALGTIVVACFKPKAHNVHPFDEKLTLSRKTTELRRAGHELRLRYARFLVVRQFYHNLVSTFSRANQVFIPRTGVP
jgi:hypothetical protein